jgi:two-component system chemotaxis sensor kinase CheA
MDDLLREFLTETGESLAKLDVEIVQLEQNPNNPEMLSSIFRLVHTIKGTCGFIGLPRLEKLAHAAENVFGKFRDGELPVTPEAISLILKSLDTIKILLAHLEQNEAEPPGEDKDLIAELNATAEGKAATPAAAKPEVSHAPAAPVNGAVADEHGFVPVRAGDVKSLESNMAAKKTEEAISPTPPVAKPLVKTGDDHAKAPSVADQSIRIDVGLLETLMTTVSELVLNRNQLLQILRSQKDSSFSAPLQRLNQVTSELQEGVMKTRMQPIGNAWSKLPRIVRDLSHELSKKIDLQMVGAETELDRQVLELIKDPLTHMVRNSADHGIEVPADRLKAGKPEMGSIVLNAYHEGGHIVIQISDDGKGLALDKIKAKIIEKSMATEAELAALSEQQIYQFIFKPGFSTAAKVTSVSGRGVGMDVVKTNIDKIGGTIDFKSVQGKGSRFFIKIPLTLAIVSALIVECAGERFAVPQLSVIELVKASADGEYRIERINNAPVLRLRNRLLPLVSLRKTLKLGNETEISKEGFVIVTQAGGATFGIMVDRVFDTEEIVVKPVSRILRDINIFSGNTILGDGNVIMILDVNGIAEGAGDMQVGEAAQQKAAIAQVRQSESRQALLLFRAGEGAPKAVPLALIARLESVDRTGIEYSNGAPVVQYRGKLMPLIPIGAMQPLEKKGTQPVLVFADEERNMGLIVDEILDIIDDNVRIDLSVQRPGYIGTAIIANKATDVIDAAHYLAQAFSDWFGAESDSTFGGDDSRRVLLVDDSPFFRNLLVPLLRVAGYQVTAAESPVEALKLQEDGQDFDVIVSDIEMPDMNGFDFAAAVRKGGRWSQLPMVALSSHATPRDLERGRAVGFTDYVAKFNRDALLASLQNSLGAKREGVGT